MTISGRVADGRLATLHGPARSCFGDKTRPVGAGSQPGRSRALNSDQHRSDCCGGTDNKWSRSDQHQMASIGEIRVQVPSGSRAAAVETGHGQRAAGSGQRAAGSGQRTAKQWNLHVDRPMGHGSWAFPFLFFHMSPPPPSFYLSVPANDGAPAVLPPRRHHPLPIPPFTLATLLTGCAKRAVPLMPCQACV
jgi:hypothetical protein